MSPIELAMLVQAAVQAPSLHNTQPWRFRLLERALEVRADPRQALRIADPFGRAVYLACGAATFNIRLAATHLGRDHLVRLVPDRDDPVLAARIDFTGRRRRSTDEELFEAIPCRHTSRLSFSSLQLPAATVRELQEAAVMEGSVLVIVPPDDAAQVTGRPVGRNGGLAPTLALLATAGDSPRDAVRAGQAMQRVLLLATARGLSTSVTSHAVDLELLRVRHLRRRRDIPQLVIRLGYGPPVVDGPGTGAGRVQRRRPDSDRFGTEALGVRAVQSEALGLQALRSEALGARAGRSEALGARAGR